MADLGKPTEQILLEEIRDLLTDGGSSALVAKFLGVEAGTIDDLTGALTTAIGTLPSTAIVLNVSHSSYIAEDGATPSYSAIIMFKV